MNEHKNAIQYSILDPTGNITALVESDVEIGRQPAIAAQIMNRHPEVEQVGFVRAAHCALRMAGGEFCGNASMCAAALLTMRKESYAEPSQSKTALRVSGASDPVNVQLKRVSSDFFQASVRMPAAVEINEKEFLFDGISDRLPVVQMEGITHIIVAASSAFYRLLRDKPAAEQAVKDWCTELDADGLGLMFLSQKSKNAISADDNTLPSLNDEEASDFALIPLVYIPGSGTVFWENSCASGTSAAGMYLAGSTDISRETKKEDLQADSAALRSHFLTFHEPAGILQVQYDASTRQTRLQGTVHYRGSYSFFDLY